MSSVQMTSRPSTPHSCKTSKIFSRIRNNIDHFSIGGSDGTKSGRDVAKSEGYHAIPNPSRSVNKSEGHASKPKSSQLTLTTADNSTRIQKGYRVRDRVNNIDRVGNDKKRSRRDDGSQTRTGNDAKLPTNYSRTNSDNGATVNTLSTGMRKSRSVSMGTNITKHITDSRPNSEECSKDFNTKHMSIARAISSDFPKRESVDVRDEQSSTKLKERRQKAISASMCKPVSTSGLIGLSEHTTNKTVGAKPGNEWKMALKKRRSDVEKQSLSRSVSSSESNKSLTIDTVCDSTVPTTVPSDVYNCKDRTLVLCRSLSYDSSSKCIDKHDSDKCLLANTKISKNADTNSHCRNSDCVKIAPPFSPCVNPDSDTNPVLHPSVRRSRANDRLSADITTNVHNSSNPDNHECDSSSYNSVKSPVNKTDIHNVNSRKSDPVISTNKNPDRRPVSRENSSENKNGVGSNVQRGRSSRRQTHERDKSSSRNIDKGSAVRSNSKESPLVTRRSARQKQTESCPVSPDTPAITSRRQTLMQMADSRSVDTSYTSNRSSTKRSKQRESSVTRPTVSSTAKSVSSSNNNETSKELPNAPATIAKKVQKTFEKAKKCLLNASPQLSRASSDDSETVDNKTHIDDIVQPPDEFKNVNTPKMIKRNVVYRTWSGNSRNIMKELTDGGLESDQVPLRKQRPSNLKLSVSNVAVKSIGDIKDNLTKRCGKVIEGLSLAPKPSVTTESRVVARQLSVQNLRCSTGEVKSKGGFSPVTPERAERNIELAAVERFTQNRFDKAKKMFEAIDKGTGNTQKRESYMNDTVSSRSRSSSKNSSTSDQINTDADDYNKPYQKTANLPVDEVANLNVIDRSTKIEEVVTHDSAMDASMKCVEKSSISSTVAKSIDQQQHNTSQLECERVTNNDNRRTSFDRESQDVANAAAQISKFINEKVQQISQDRRDESSVNDSDLKSADSVADRTPDLPVSSITAHPLTDTKKRSMVDSGCITDCTNEQVSDDVNSADVESCDTEAVGVIEEVFTYLQGEKSSDTVTVSDTSSSCSIDSLTTDSTNNEDFPVTDDVIPLPSTNMCEQNQPEPTRNEIPPYTLPDTIKCNPTTSVENSCDYSHTPEIPTEIPKRISITKLDTVETTTGSEGVEGQHQTASCENHSLEDQKGIYSEDVNLANPVDNTEKNVKLTYTVEQSAIEVCEHPYTDQQLASNMQDGAMKRKSSCFSDDEMKTQLITDHDVEMRRKSLSPADGNITATLLERRKALYERVRKCLSSSSIQFSSTFRHTFEEPTDVVRSHSYLTSKTKVDPLASKPLSQCREKKDREQILCNSTKSLQSCTTETTTFSMRTSSETINNDVSDDKTENEFDKLITSIDQAKSSPSHSSVVKFTNRVNSLKKSVSLTPKTRRRKLIQENRKSVFSESLLKTFNADFFAGGLSGSLNLGSNTNSVGASNLPSSDTNIGAKLQDNVDNRINMHVEDTVNNNDSNITCKTEPCNSQKYDSPYGNLFRLKESDKSAVCSKNSENIVENELIISRRPPMIYDQDQEEVEMRHKPLKLTSSSGDPQENGVYQNMRFYNNRSKKCKSSVVEYCSGDRSSIHDTTPCNNYLQANRHNREQLSSTNSHTTIGRRHSMDIDLIESNRNQIPPKLPEKQKVYPQLSVSRWRKGVSEEKCSRRKTKSETNKPDDYIERYQDQNSLEESSGFESEVTNSDSSPISELDNGFERLSSNQPPNEFNSNHTENDTNGITKWRSLSELYFQSDISNCHKNCDQNARYYNDDSLENIRGHAIDSEDNSVYESDDDGKVRVNGRRYPITIHRSDDSHAKRKKYRSNSSRRLSSTSGSHCSDNSIDRECQDDVDPSRVGESYDVNDTEVYDTKDEPRTLFGSDDTSGCDSDDELLFVFDNQGRSCKIPMDYLKDDIRLSLCWSCGESFRSHTDLWRHKRDVNHD